MGCKQEKSSGFGVQNLTDWIRLFFLVLRSRWKWIRDLCLDRPIVFLHRYLPLACPTKLTY